MKKLKPGMVFYKKYENCPHMVLLLSADRRPDDGLVWWKCAYFQHSNSIVFGAFIKYHLPEDFQDWSLKGDISSNI